MIRTQTRDHVMCIEIARPEKKNALTLDMYAAMTAFFEKRKPDFSRF